MSKADVFAMVSTNETLGLVYLEAMSQGCITIGSKGEGIDGIIKDGVNGYLCEPKNIESVKCTLLKALTLRCEERAIIVGNAINTIMNYTEDRVVSNYLEVIEEAIGDKLME